MLGQGDNRVRPAALFLHSSKDRQTESFECQERRDRFRELSEWCVEDAERMRRNAGSDKWKGRGHSPSPPLPCRGRNKRPGWWSPAPHFPTTNKTLRPVVRVDCLFFLSL